MDSMTWWLASVWQAMQALVTSSAEAKGPLRLSNFEWSAVFAAAQDGPQANSARRAMIDRVIRNCPFLPCFPGMSIRFGGRGFPGNIRAG
jgi:hypothetical protein